MDLNLNDKLVSEYHSGSQKARVLTESWVGEHLFCPRCGNEHLRHFQNNRPVADFICPSCSNQYELKSKQGKLGAKIADGAYDTFIKRMYQFETYLYDRHQGNNNVRPKIRQQLQLLRDRGVIEFLGMGKYRKIKRI